MKRSTVIIVAAALALGVFGGAAYGYYAWTHHSKINITSAEVFEPIVTTSSSLTGMLPGDSRPLAVDIRNPNAFPVKLTKVAGGTAATPSGCPEWAIRVKEPSKSDPAFVIPARSDRRLAVRVEMQKWADRKCAGQRFELDLLTTIEPT
ncbi:hypothetical protein Ato02nite_097200 [Paractinoplanes toevensis]|uniref:Uncharacterized protein n=1 Tax=Paractinoplanes toevensis TaxID=571911 RepID=A0A919WCV8_9ACTN|nr:hypothetical protein Ato02nite_097200 [Actinoplanes toevensis]